MISSSVWRMTVQLWEVTTKTKIMPWRPWLEKAPSMSQPALNWLRQLSLVSFYTVFKLKKTFFFWYIFVFTFTIFFIENLEVPSVTITSSASGTATTSTTPAGSATSSSTLQPSNHRRKKPKRRSTGVVNLDVDVS